MRNGHAGERGTEAPEVSEELDRIVARSVAPTLTGLIVLFPAFAVAYQFVHPPEIAARVAVANIVSGLTCLAALVHLRRTGPLPTRSAQPAMFAVASLVVVNLLYNNWVGATPGLPLYFMLTAVGAGLTLLSWRMVLLFELLLFSSWSALVLSLVGPREWLGLALYLAAAVALGLITHATRLQAYRRIGRLRLEDERLKQELRHAVKTAQASESRLRTVITSAPVVLFALDAEGRLTFADGKGLEPLGIDPREVLGKSVYELYADAPAIGRNVKRALAGEAFAEDVELQGLVYHTRYAPVRDASGRVTGVTGVATDVTERQQAEANLAAAHRQMLQSEKLSALGTLVAGVAHEINNPLASVRAHVELTQLSLEDALADQTPGSPAVDALRDAIESGSVILQNIDRIAHITKSLKDVARASDGERTDEDVNELVESALTVAGSRLKWGARVVRDLRATRPARANGNEVSQVLLNLIMNAADAMRPMGEGTLTLRTRDVGDHVLIEVEDTGPGIPEEAQHQVFTPFFTTKGKEGTGLGLSISHRIVEDHGGRLTLRSAEGRGTTFRMELPSAPATPESGPSPKGQRRPERSLK